MDKLFNDDEIGELEAILDQLKTPFSSPVIKQDYLAAALYIIVPKLKNLSVPRQTVDDSFGSPTQSRE